MDWKFDMLLRPITTILAAVALVASVQFAPIAAVADTPVTPAEARQIAEEAFLYGFPAVDAYRIQHTYFVDAKGAEYKGLWNQPINTPRVYTPADTTVQTPNSDTPYSFAGLDLRAEPIVLTIPKIDKDRYFSV